MEIENYVNGNNLVSSVKFLGLQSNVYGYLHDADVFTLPSNYEGIPMTLIEAMGTGMPIVATAVGGVPDMVENNVHAVIVSNETLNIVEAFDFYYSEEKNREFYGKKARERSVLFSAYNMAKKYSEIYENALF